MMDQSWEGRLISGFYGTCVVGSGCSGRWIEEMG